MHQLPYHNLTRMHLEPSSSLDIVLAVAAAAAAAAAAAVVLVCQRDSCAYFQPRFVYQIESQVQRSYESRERLHIPQRGEDISVRTDVKSSWIIMRCYSLRSRICFRDTESSKNTLPFFPPLLRDFNPLSDVSSRT